MGAESQEPLPRLPDARLKLHHRREMRQVTIQVWNTMALVSESFAEESEEGQPRSQCDAMRVYNLSKSIWSLVVYSHIPFTSQCSAPRHPFFFSSMNSSVISP